MFVFLFKVKYADLVKKMHLQLLKESVQPDDKMHRPSTRAMWDQQRQGSLHLRIGEWVEILHEYAKGVCSDGGVGCIVEVHEATDPDDTEPSLNGAKKIDVKYLLDGHTEKYTNPTSGK